MSAYNFAFWVRKVLFNVLRDKPLESLFKARALGFLLRNERAAVHFFFHSPRPAFGVRLDFEGFALRRVALAPDTHYSIFEGEAGLFLTACATASAVFQSSESIGLRSKGSGRAKAPAMACILFSVGLPVPFSKVVR